MMNILWHLTEGVGIPGVVQSTRCAEAQERRPSATPVGADELCVPSDGVRCVPRNVSLDAMRSTTRREPLPNPLGCGGGHSAGMRPTVSSNHRRRTARLAARERERGPCSAIARYPSDRGRRGALWGEGGVFGGSPLRHVGEWGRSGGHWGRVLGTPRRIRGERL